MAKTASLDPEPPDQFALTSTYDPALLALLKSMPLDQRAWHAQRRVGVIQTAVAADVKFNNVTAVDANGLSTILDRTDWDVRFNHFEFRFELLIALACNRPHTVDRAFHLLLDFFEFFVVTRDISPLHSERSGVKSTHQLKEMISFHAKGMKSSFIRYHSICKHQDTDLNQKKSEYNQGKVGKGLKVQYDRDDELCTDKWESVNNSFAKLS